ncbi:MAG: xanthine dehydrogenase family protein molybdopterin-binding subunit [Chloroflexi bacterium]|nr:xanthine dehydrogenase family protein molybdopterin-binding subunit [Chloroflexota bacterium]
MAKSSLIGKAIPRVDAPGKVLGKTEYVMDLKLPGMLEGRILRSPLPHAEILSIDTGRAEKLPGVKAVVTAVDFPDLRYGHLVEDQTILARDRVRYVGERVAAVAAVDLETAEEALDLIRVEYRELTPIFDPLEALKPDAPRIHPEIDRYGVVFASIIKYGNVCSISSVKRGNVDEGFAQADLIFEDTFTTPMVHQSCTEPHAVVAQVEPSGKVVVWTATPAAFKFRDGLAEILGMPTNMVKVIACTVGGSFGAKNDLRLDPICARLAQKSRRIVRMTMDREEEFADGNPRHSSIIQLKTGVMRDGRIVARWARMVFDTGAYTEFGPAVASEATKQISGPYRIPNVEVEALAVYTNKVSCACFRAHGGPEPTFAYESQMDIIAAGLGIDPIELRLKNAVADGDIAPTGEPYRKVSLQANLRRAAAHVNWDSKPQGKNRGLGIAVGQWHTGGRAASAIVKMDEHGKVFISTGCVDVTGSHTSLIQITAEELGVPLADVQIVPIDTDSAPFDASSSGTRSTHNVGGVLRRCAGQIREQVLTLAAEILEARRDDLDIEDGRIFVKGTPERGIPLARASRQAFRASGGPIVASGAYPGGALPTDPQALRGLCFGTAVEFIHPVQVAEVEVDPETGQVTLHRLTAIEDVGKAINPICATGQIEGGVVQGIGYALSEEIVCQNGVILNPCGVPYLQPTARDVPQIDTVLVEDGQGSGPHGAKGIGEAPIIPTAPAIANAIYDAIGVRIKSLPITAEKIVAAIRESAK